MGKRRTTPFRASTMGWNARPRTKVSAYAAKGYAFEVRLPQADRWPCYTLVEEPCPYAELFQTLRVSTDCRIVGHGPYTNRKCNARKAWSVRVYLRTEADLFHLRMLTNDVFRVYALRAPESA